MSSTSERPTVAVIGGGYAGIRVAKGLDEDAEVTLVDPKQAFVHNIAAWRALVSPEWLERIFFPYERLLARGRFLRDSAVAVDGRQVTLASGERLDPDYLILATGSKYPFPAKTEEPTMETARTRMRQAHQALLGSERVLVVGAGPSGLELAGEIKAFFPDKQVTIISAEPELVPGLYAEELRSELHRQLDALGIELKLGVSLRELPEVEPAVVGPIAVETEEGEELRADIWFRCFGVSPHTDYLRGDLAAARDERRYLRVDERLQVIGQERVFALGDAADADRDMAGMAKFQSEVLVPNLKALFAGQAPTATYERFPPAIVIPLGPHGGAGELPGKGVVGSEVTAELKGQALGVDSIGALFDVEPAAASALG
jgi:NADH dehydrogenase FAD-containing subunit